ncbi:hypothetical protein [Streptomyces sp. NPDC056883]|uniref:hypothetical protein n=1 Tax=Streptomyces sp. NPDC056883 TaxID=3345959 RepID=UPI00368DB67F
MATTGAPTGPNELARIATEIVPSGSDYGNLLAQVVQPDEFPTLASLMTSGAMEDDGNVRPALDFGLKSRPRRPQDPHFLTPACHPGPSPFTKPRWPPGTC